MAFFHNNINYEYRTYNESQLNTYFIITRILAGIGTIPFVILFIIYFQRRHHFTVMILLNLQLSISQFFGNGMNYYPLMNTEQRVHSIWCSIQAIQSNIASISRNILVFIIILYSYLGFSYSSFFSKHSYKMTIVFLFYVGCSQLGFRLFHY